MSASQSSLSSHPAGASAAGKEAKLKAAFGLLLEAAAAPHAALAGREAGWAQAAATQAARVWSAQLLCGEGQDASAPLRNAARARVGAGPVLVERVGVHLVCPHHLTVAFGHATIGYVPGPYWAPFGALSDMLSLSCGRLVFQEEATLDAAAALVRGLDAKAAWVRLQASHPCHRLSTPRAHAARVITEATAGERRLAVALARGARARKRRTQSRVLRVP